MNIDSKLMTNTLKKRSKITEKAIQNFQEELDQRQNEEIREANLFIALDQFVKEIPKEIIPIIFAEINL